MIYIDTGVLAHAYVVQESAKNRQANQLIRQANANDIAVISTLTVQELLFVLAKLGIEDEVIHAAYNEVMQLEPIAYDTAVLQRAFDLSVCIGFRNISDCIHTAIAEQHCTELITWRRLRLLTGRGRRIRFTPTCVGTAAPSAGSPRR